MTDIERNELGQIVSARLDTKDAIERGRKGGLKKVPKGAAKLSPEERHRIAMLGVEKRRQLREARKKNETN